MLSPTTRWAFGTVDIYGFERVSGVLPAGVLMEGPDRGAEFYVRRIETGDHEAALALELGLRARSWLDPE